MKHTIRQLKEINAKLLDALQGTLAAIDVLCPEAEDAQVSIAVAMSVIEAKEAIRKATE